MTDLAYYSLIGLGAAVTATAVYKGWFSRSTFSAARTLGARGIFELASTLIKLRLLKKMGVGILERSMKYESFFEVSYYDGGKKCTMLLKKERGPSKITKVVGDVDGVDADVTEEVMGYAGPARNFYGTSVTPKHLGRRGISFHYRNGDVRRFEHDQSITLG
jgi:hypothetical protein